jgi:hypothetical protein
MKLDKTKLYYLSHPYTTYGDMEQNRKNALNIENELGVSLINPICLELGNGKQTPMQQCLKLLSACDGIIMCDNWQNSMGCKEEWDFALANNIEVLYLDEVKSNERD